MIRVLQVFNRMGNGGIEHYIMDRYRLIDKSKIQFDFLITSPNKAFFDDEIAELGGKVYHTVSFANKPLRCVLQTINIVKDNHYSIVHRHSGNAIAYIDLLAAKMGGAKYLIMHSHNNNAEKLFIHRIAKKFLALECIRVACSDVAGNWMFDKKEYSIMNNAIDISKYQFSEYFRKIYREKYCITDDDFVVGHIGRLDYQKNHDFLLDIFKEIITVRPNAKLICVGDGHLMNICKEKAKSLGIDEKVIWTGSINNVNELINCFDVFCLPSKYEGFSITLIEAQVNGLRCYASKDNVTEASNISGNVRYVDLNNNAYEWAEAILNNFNTRDIHASERVMEAGFDLYQSVKELQDFYLEFENEQSFI